jgi:Tannase and feruloyl esterase
MLRTSLLAAVVLALAAAPARAATCPRQNALRVPGAERQVADCLDDLTTKGTAASGHTDPSDWAGLNSQASRNPDTVVPGLQVDGYFPDSSTSNAWRGWNHDSQFVIRLPNRWNGKLVVTGAPGIRRQFAADYVIGDFAVARGYAYASTDKGNNGTTFYRDGVKPGDAVAEWNARVTQLTRAAKEAVRSRYGRAPAHTYMTGISNGGYLTRWQLEHHPELYDGGVDWEGTLFTPDGPNLFTYLPVALRNYAGWKRGDEAAHRAFFAAGFAPGSEQQWDDHYAEYWDLTQRTYREEFDPGYDGPLEAGNPFCRPGTPACDADYDYASRPQAVHDAVGRVSLTGRIGKPLLTLHGTLDALLPIRTDSDVYDRMIRAAGRGSLHRYYRIEGGGHVDGRYDAHPSELRPILPCYRAAFVAFEAMIEHGAPPPPDQTVARTAGGDVANRCPLKAAPAGAAVPGAARAKPRLHLRVRPRHVRAGHRTRFRFRVTSRGKPVRGAKVRFAGKTKRTGRHGRATIVRRLRHRGLRRVTVRKRGLRTAKARVRVLRRR